MWMEWTIPIQKLEVSKIQFGPLQRSFKPLTPLSYTDGPIVFQNLNLLLPPLQVKEYDSSTGKLILSLADSPGTAAKLFALQDSLLNAVYTNQKLWFQEGVRTRDQIQNYFQSFVENTSLHLYCPLSTQEKRHSISIWKDNQWKKFESTGLFAKGDSLRVAMRLQGISYQMNPTTNAWTGRFRVQHKISCLYACPKQKVVEEQKC